VDDECVEHLLKLTHLRALNVAGTSISINSYGSLLSGLPQIQDIVWSDPIDPVLRDLTVCLPSVKSFVGNISDAELLVMMCPNVTHIFLHSTIEDISVLGELRSVVALSIFISNCNVIGFSALIRGLGPNLTILEMHQVENINIDYIINYCTVLNTLTISHCHVTQAEIFDIESPHFLNLTIKKKLGTV
jgi:hypothetical protein